MPVDETALNNLLGKMVGDLGAAMGARSSSSAINWDSTKRWPARGH